MKRTVLFIFLSITISSFSQLKTYEKAKKTFAEGNLKGANKLIEKCLLDKETKENPNVLLLKSQIMFGIFKDKTLLEKFPSALKDAMKYAEKAIDANPSESAKTTFREKHMDYFSVLIRQNNLEALEAYNTKKYARALPLFKKSIAFGLDTQSLALAGDCLWQMGQETESMPYFKKSADLIYKAVLDSNSKVFGYFKEPFRKMGKYYVDRQQFDSAYIVVKNGREILPNDPVLTEYTYTLMRFALDKIPPSDDYLNFVQQGLSDFPTDSFLNHRENSIYIFLLNGMAVANEQSQFDSLLGRYAKSKEAKSKLKGIETIKKYDIFAGQGRASFVQNLKYYFADIDLPEACYATAYYQFLYVEKQTNAPTYTFIENFIMKESRPLVADILFTRAEKILEPKTAVPNPMAKSVSVLKSNRSSYTLSKNKTNPSYYELLPMIRLNDACAKDFPKDLGFKAKAKAYRLRLISETSDSGDFRLARRIWHESVKLYPEENKTLDNLWRKMVENDFRLNYFGSRVNMKGKNEKGVLEYNWNGNADSCIAGVMPMNIIEKVENRINYFRRMAGVTEQVVLTIQDNEYCQYAAMMCEANKTMSHEPNDGWRCYIPAGADALKNSILSKDGNPCIAITAAMGQNNASVGNRRWLLYPYALYMGIGTSRNFSAIKAIDKSQEIDSNTYKINFVAWPPAKDCPKMLVFKKWSFSIEQNLKGAVVSMKDAGGQAVNLKQDEYTVGYGLNTLVWEPEINVAALSADTEYTVSIKLASGKTYTYKVKIIDVKL